MENRILRGLLGDFPLWLRKYIGNKLTPCDKAVFRAAFYGEKLTHPNLLKYAISYDLLDFAMKLRAEGYPVEVETLITAIEYADCKTCRWVCNVLLSQGTPIPPIPICKAICADTVRSGICLIMQHVFVLCKGDFLESMIIVGATYELILWLFTYNTIALSIGLSPFQWTKKMLLGAIFVNNEELFLKLVEHGCPYDEEVYNFARRCQRVNIMNWLEINLDRRQ